MSSVQLNEGGESTVEAKNVVIATGSKVTPFLGGAIVIDEEQVVSSTGTLSFQSVPGMPVVIGGGSIGDGRCVGPSWLPRYRRQVSE